MTGRESVLKHVQVREYVRDLLSDAPPGSPAPSERELVARFGVARMTVRQALDALVIEGRLERIPGRGTFVAKPPRPGGALVSFAEDMAARGHAMASQSLLLRCEQAGPGVARAMNLTSGDAVIHWRRLRSSDEGVVCLEDAYLNEVLLPGFLLQPEPVSLYAEFESRGLRPTWAEDAVSAALAVGEEATLLRLPPGSPALHISRRAYTDGKVLEVSKSSFRPDRYTAYYQLGRHS